MKKKIDKADWDKVHEAAVDIVNASSMNDEILTASKREILFEVLDLLEEKYGDRPSIIGTRGDFTEDPDEAQKYFNKALQLARSANDKSEEEEILDSIKNLNEGRTRP